MFSLDHYICWLLDILFFFFFFFLLITKYAGCWISFFFFFFFITILNIKNALYLAEIALFFTWQIIVLSVYGDKELVYKGVTHGAVDYLVKSVRIEELRNIWQHVIRRKKRYLKGDNGSPDQHKSREVVGETGQRVASSSGMDHSSRKTKGKEEEDDGAGEENGTESDELGNQKKPRK